MSVVNTCDLFYFVSTFISKGEHRQRLTPPPVCTAVSMNVCNNKTAYVRTQAASSLDNHFNLIFIFIFCRRTVVTFNIFFWIKKESCLMMIEFVLNSSPSMFITITSTHHLNEERSYISHKQYKCQKIHRNNNLIGIYI